MKKKGLSTSLKNLVLYDDVAADLLSAASEVGLTTHTFSAVLKIGEETPAEQFPERETQPDDTYIFSYTSGTTGDSKGVKLTHANLMAAVAGVNAICPTDDTDVIVSYLPLPHSFEQCLFTMSCLYGAAIGFYQGDPTKLTEDCALLRPTLFPSVPRLYNKIYGLIKGRLDAATGCSRWLINNGLASKTANAQNAVYTHGCYDALVFKKIKAILGGRVRFMITGSAPIDLQVLDFLKVVFCCPIMEGYGLTESSGGATITRMNDPNAGHVGGPVRSLRIRLKDVPEMSYLHTDKPYPRGEVCMKGPSIFAGYFSRPDKTAECMEEGNWFKTGDVGMIYPNGTIKIIDRSKNIFKLSQGEYIAPEKMENIFVLSPVIEQCMVYGDSLKNACVAVVVPKQPAADKWKAAHGDNWMSHADVKKEILAEMVRLANEAHCTSLEKPKKVFVTPDAFSVDNDILTPTFKLKRNVAKKIFQDQIDEMYKELTAEEQARDAK